MFRLKKKAKTKATQAQTQAQATQEIVQPTFNYGVDMAGIYLRSNDFGWETDETAKKVILVNPLQCKEKVNFMGLVSAWRGTGHAEWEALLAYWFLTPVIEAIEKDEEEADISNCFNKELQSSKGKMSKEQVFAHIIKWRIRI